MKTGLVLEGGAMRGMFTCGVIDTFMQNGITFDGAIGVSAGAAFLQEDFFPVQEFAFGEVRRQGLFDAGGECGAVPAEQDLPEYQHGGAPQFEPANV